MASAEGKLRDLSISFVNSTKSETLSGLNVDNSSNIPNATKESQEVLKKSTYSKSSYATPDSLESNQKSFHKTQPGYCTSTGRIDWCKAHGISDAEHAQVISKSLEADADPTAPLYYWQLFSLLGIEMIHKLVTDFYESIYDDDEEEAAWFRNVFVEIGDADHHITSQTAFWVDSFGGGPYYHGGDYRLRFHHENNADQVMNSEGAARWMHHMKHTLLQCGHAELFNAMDVRILPCIIDFLHVKMEKYAVENNWPFDKKPFDELREYIISTNSC